MPQPGRRGRRARIAALLTALGFAAAAAPASAVTVGQLPPGTTPPLCDGPLDLVQPSVIGGNTYVVPSTGGITSWTVTSWSTNASVQADQTAGLKFFRKVGEPARFQVVGHEAQHTLVAGLNTFPASLRVSAGDILGMHYTGSGACAFDPGVPELVYFIPADLADGQSDDFDGDGPARLNMAAELSPTNDFTLGKPKTKPNGTAVLTAEVPNPGELTVSGKGVTGSARAAGAKKVPAGKVKVVIRAKGKNARKLSANDKVTVKPKITFTPTGGSPNTEKKKVKLRRK
jgi:hypothetical protein